MNTYAPLIAYAAGVITIAIILYISSSGFIQSWIAPLILILLGLGIYFLCRFNYRTVAWILAYTLPVLFLIVGILGLGIIVGGEPGSNYTRTLGIFLIFLLPLLITGLVSWWLTR